MVQDGRELKLEECLLRARFVLTVLPEIVKCNRRRYYERLEYAERKTSRILSLKEVRTETRIKKHDQWVFGALLVYDINNGSFISIKSITTVGQIDNHRE